jgi:GNAT superfamily N-acetyltransferase
MTKLNHDSHLRKALLNDKEVIWKIIEKAIIRRKEDGSKQWQDGYPNLDSIENDIKNDYGYVLESENKILGYAAIMFEIEPAYEIIEGEWLSDQKYVVIHRVAISEECIGLGLATKIFKKIERIAVFNNIFSIKVDTNFDNIPLLRILDKLKYTYCGEVYFRGSARKAFQKLLKLEDSY